MSKAKELLTKLEQRGQIAILPLGMVNLKTGASSPFNVIEEWGDSFTAEVWKGSKGTVVIFTSGKKGLFSDGTTKEFMHDQTQKFLFDAKKVTEVSVPKLPTLVSKYGNKLKGFVYK